MGSVHEVHPPSDAVARLCRCPTGPCSHHSLLLLLLTVMYCPPPLFPQYDQTLSDLDRLVAKVGQLSRQHSRSLRGRRQQRQPATANRLVRTGSRWRQWPTLRSLRPRRGSTATQHVSCWQSRQACPAAREQQATLLLQAEEALAALGCAHLACTNCAGASEAGFKGRRCGGCRLVRYCGEACRDADWARHRPQCRRLQLRQAPGRG